MAPPARMSNAEIAAALREAAALLRAQGASPFRVAAYEKAADTAEALPQSLATLAAGGIEALEVIFAFGLNFARGAAVKYLLRAGRKRGVSELQDVEKAYYTLGREIARMKRGKR